MKKAFTLLGVIGIVSIALCTFSVSASEKPDTIKTYNYISNVSHGTFEDMATVIYVPAYLREEFGHGASSFNKLAVLSVGLVMTRCHNFSDPYRIRSQAWIKWNNIKARGDCSGIKTDKLRISLTPRLTC